MQHATTKREPLPERFTVREAVVHLSEGNPDAINVMMATLAYMPNAHQLLRRLDEMNIRGRQVFVMFRDICGGNDDTFRTALLMRDALIVDALNARIVSAQYQHVAIAGDIYNRSTDA